MLDTVLGKNHAVYAAAAWVGAWPFTWYLPGVSEEVVNDFGLLTITTAVAAGAGVIPDLDHPDARPSKHFGICTRLVSRALNSASGGHRFGTHSFLFAALLGVISWLAWLFPDEFGRLAASIACAFCASVGLTLAGPSLGIRIPSAVSVASAVIPAWYAWVYFDRISPFLWVLAAGGVIVHIACDAVTKGGVPLFWPFTKKRFMLGLFRVGGRGESVAGVIGVLGFGAGVWHVIVTAPPIT